MSQRSRLSGEDHSSIVAAWLPAGFPQWWRSYVDLSAERKRWRELELGFVERWPNRIYQAQRLEAAGFAKDYARDELEHSRAFWLAWYRLLEVYPAATAKLPAPDTDPEKIDPDAAAAAVREAIGMLSVSEDDDDEWMAASQACEWAKSIGIKTSLTAMNLAKGKNEFKSRPGGAGVSYEVEIHSFHAWFWNKKPRAKKNSSA